MLISIKEFLKYNNLHKDREKLFLYLYNFDIDISLVGRRLAQGLQHNVYEYGTNHVLKVPKFDWINLIYGTLNPNDVIADQKLINRHFHKFAVPTKVLQSKDNELYCIVQQRIRKKFNINSRNIHLVINQFNEIYTTNKHMEQITGYSLDLWGKSGILRSIQKSFKHSNIFIEMTNMIIEKDALQNYRIKIIDTNLFKVKISGRHISRIFSDKLIYSMSDFVLKYAHFLTV